MADNENKTAAEVAEIDLVDGISARLENLCCFAEALREHVGMDSSRGSAVGQFSILRTELDQVLDLTEELSHRLLAREPKIAGGLRSRSESTKSN